MGTTSWQGAVRTVVDGLWFTEGPRWHDGALWCSDIFGHRVLRMQDDGGGGDMVAETVVEVPDDEPSGLGWLPDGRLLVVGMQRRLVYRLESDGSLEVHADLSSVARGVLNDMIVSAEGRAYVGDMGLDPNDHDAGVHPGQLLCIEPDGSFSTVADDLGAPNGPALTDDGGTLILAESSAFHLSTFAVEADGTLSGRAIFAAVPPAPGGPGYAPPDGICLDSAGAVWVADPSGARVVRLLRGGALTHSVDFQGEVPVACVLGGPDRRTLYICVAADYRREAVLRQPLGRIDAVTVEVAGSGRP
jgi:sugar lactone lactonase YvrE